MKKLTFEIRSPAHQQNAIHAVQQILPDPTKPIVVTIQERNRSLDQNRKLWACLGDSLVRLNGMVAGWMQKAGSVCLPQH
ncbi:recombination protein [Escherichia coli]|nr:recombination protein [Escherichia coli]